MFINPQIILDNSDVVQAQWEDGNLLGANGLSYGNGMVTLFDIYYLSHAGNASKRRIYNIFPRADSTIGSILKYNDDPWTAVEIYSNPIIIGNLTFVCGAGSMGNEGFVAATDVNGLVWAFFSSESNPFNNLELVGEKLKAYSDSQVYSIDLNNLTNIEVIYHQ